MGTIKIESAGTQNHSFERAEFDERFREEFGIELYALGDRTVDREVCATVIGVSAELIRAAGLNHLTVSLTGSRCQMSSL